MRAIRAATTVLLGAASLALTAVPSAVAADGGGAPAANPRAPRAKAVGDFVITPGIVAPGGRITLSAPGCAGTATASSGVFDTVTIPAGAGSTALVDTDAKRGAVYTVTFTCSTGIQGTVDLTISGGATSTPTPTSRSTAVAPLTTPRGVAGGLGGSTDATNAWTLAAGGTLVVAAAGGLVYAIRRRSAAGRRH
ncbi:hypothetical protein ACIGO8_06645 [Streptomyces sp. NPDC053493]|uniref:hypothetical protein n=1 Tax=Streptomyces sp. NPDC053493 TaxID=3365705 RepID=UPI0037D509A3